MENENGNIHNIAKDTSSLQSDYIHLNSWHE